MEKAEANKHEDELGCSGISLVVLSGRQFSSTGNDYPHLEIFWVLRPGRGGASNSIYWVEARDVSKNTTMHSTACHDKELFGSTCQ